MLALGGERSGGGGFEKWGSSKRWGPRVGMRGGSPNRHVEVGGRGALGRGDRGGGVTAEGQMFQIKNRLSHHESVFSKQFW